MLKKHGIAQNLLINWFGHFANILVMFLISPFVVNTLGPVQYGIWSLVTVLTGYLGVLDLGVRASTGRFVIFYIGKGDHRKVDETIRTALGFFSAVGMLMLLAGVGLGWVFPKAISSVPEQHHGLIKILLPVMAVNMWVSVVRAIHACLFTAHDRFDLARCGQTLGGPFLRSISPVPLPVRQCAWEVRPIPRAGRDQ